jgi:hypothetical protein
VWGVAVTASHLGGFAAERRPGEEEG